jgi:hypothetical protein
MPRRCAWPSLGFLLAALWAMPALAVTAPVYKCFDSHLALVYTDLPCKDGEQVDIRAGDADPAAVERLERERDMLDLSAAQRMLDERRAAQMQPVSAPEEDMSPEQAEQPGYGYLAYPTYLRRMPRHPRVHRLSSMHRPVHSSSVSEPRR